MKKLTNTKWISFDFGPPDANKNEKEVSPPKKINTPNRASKCLKPVKSSNKNSNLDFFKLTEPKSIEDLMVHPKKVQELKNWLNFVIERPATSRKHTDMLLLSGPTGSGKASTLQILCKELNANVTEWTNPIDIDYAIFKGPGQLAIFSEFFNESKYCSLFSTNNKKVVVVKDFPNAIVRNPEEFFTILENIYYKATHPVIFICTDSNSDEINFQRFLFPEEILLKYSISCLSFNSCAPTLLKKGLKRALDILKNYPETFSIPSQNTFEDILASSMGDIRCAMNQLNLACIEGKADLPVVKIIGCKRKRNENTLQNMTRDKSLGLFHGLGRVLNPKRIQEGNSWRLNCDIEKLVDEFAIQPTKFASFLFENYLKYFGDLEDVQKASEVLSCSSSLLESWDCKEILAMGLWTAVLGLMASNEHKVSKWNQIKGPRKIERELLNNDAVRVDPCERYYYNIITKSDKYRKFKYDF